MQQAKNLTAPSDPSPPHLKLRPASVDHGDEGADPADGPALSIKGDVVYVARGTILPHRCVKCGDAMDTLPSRTLRGGIRYRLCRDHVVSTVAYVLAGMVLVTLAIAAVGSTLIGDPIVNARLTVVCILLGLGGAALVYWALPILASRSVDGRHQVRRLHSDVIDDLRRIAR